MSKGHSDKLRHGLQNVAESLSSRPHELRGPFASIAAQLGSDPVDPSVRSSALIKSLKQAEAIIAERDAEIERLRTALGDLCWGHDNPLTDILFGDMPDDKSMNFTIPLGTYRKARAALAGGSDHE